jgi:hypothetical protein
MFKSCLKKPLIVISILVLILTCFCISKLISAKKNILPKDHFIQGNYKIPNGNIENALDATNKPLFVIHFFDWFSRESAGVILSNLPHDIDWGFMDLNEKDLGRYKYYKKNFEFVKNIGVDAITWEFYAEKNGDLRTPNRNVIKALAENKLKIGIFYDWEIMHANGIPELSQEAYIKPTSKNVDKITHEIEQFYGRIPRDLWFFDNNKRLVIFVFAFGYDKSNNNLAQWNHFYANISSDLEKSLGTHVKIYLTGINLIQEETAFINEPDNYQPFNFVLDQPQQLFGKDVVTWNFNFDNYGVTKRDNLPRILRLDGRYWQEMFDLVKKQQPNIVFMYSWNEPFEGSTLIPTIEYKDERLNFVKNMISDIKKTNIYTKTSLTIIDDYPAGIIQNDWHCTVEKDFMLYHLKRFFPNTDVVKKDNITPDILKKYKLIIDLSVYKSPIIANYFINHLNDAKYIFFDPLLKSDMILKYFFKDTKLLNMNSNQLLDPKKCPSDYQQLFIRDDSASVQLDQDAKALLNTANNQPIIIKKGGNYFINSYTPNYCILQILAQDLYQRPMQNQILYGEGLQSQNLYVKSGVYTKNRFSRPGITEHNLFIPDTIRESPKEISTEYYNFLNYGL